MKVKSWKTSILGLLMGIAGGIAVAPDMVWSWFPKEECGNLAWHIIRVAQIMVFIAPAAFGMVAKDSNVTGGTVPSSFEAIKRTVKDSTKNFVPSIAILLSIGLATLLLSGCVSGWKLGGRVEHEPSGIGVSVDYNPKVAGFQK